MGANRLQCFRLMDIPAEHQPSCYPRPHIRTPHDDLPRIHLFVPDMVIKSLYPDLPVIPPTNVHNILFRRPEQKDWSNFTLHIDAATGKKRSYREFYERVIDGATALGSPVSEKGLGLKGGDGELVGIMAENCMVRLLYLIILASH